MTAAAGAGSGGPAPHEPAVPPEGRLVDLVDQNGQEWVRAARVRELLANIAACCTHPEWKDELAYPAENLRVVKDHLLAAIRPFVGNTPGLGSPWTDPSKPA